ncbi:hypothetical protein GCM10025777_30760 [Membranihabitans marinus]
MKVKGDIVKLLIHSSDRLVVTKRGIYYFSSDTWTHFPEQNDIVTASLDPSEKIYLASRHQVFDERGKVIINASDILRDDSIQSMLWSDSKTLYLGTSKGLLIYKNGSLDWHDDIIKTKVNDIVSGQEEEIWVATDQGLWRIHKDKAVNLDKVIMAEGHFENYHSLGTYNSGKNIIMSSSYAVGCIAADGQHWMYTGPDGLPYGPATTIATFNEDLWLGTDKGAIKKDSSWHYYQGKRWLKDDEVVDILPINETSTWIATTTGISEIRKINTSLADKAKYYNGILEERHNRHGMINRSYLAIPGDISTSQVQNQDNDGLWTATYLIAECYRYACTGEEDAKQNAIRTFEALERLETVTGISGYPARSYAPIEDQVIQSRSPHPKKWHISKDKKWRWLDDTSSDEITGHMYSISLFCELVASEDLKKRAIALMTRIVDHIIDQDYQLIDADGKPTRWGIWNPDSLNHSANWAYERGLNSLQILSFLKTTYHFTGDQKYEDEYQYLIQEHGYAENALRAKVYGPFEVSHSDDILNFFPYYGLLHYTKNDPYKHLFIRSLERTWRAVASDHMPVWNVMASAWLSTDCDLHIAKEELQLYPMDLIDWSVKNSHRWDLIHSPMVDRQRKPQAISAIPAPENQIFRWNTNPKQLDTGGNGQREVSGTYYLVAYWMGRYYGFFK